MSIHAYTDWDGVSVPEDKHVDAVITALWQNYAQLGPRWTPTSWSVLCPADAVLFYAARILDICGFDPLVSDFVVVAENIPEDRRPVVVGFLKRIFKHILEVCPMPAKTSRQKFVLRIALIYMRNNIDVVCDAFTREEDMGVADMTRLLCTDGEVGTAPNARELDELIRSLGGNS